MEKIIQDSKKFIQLCPENFWVGEELHENFKILVDTNENQLDKYLNSNYQGTPLWFYFLSIDSSFFDYFKERISLKSDWDYSLLFNIDYIDSTQYFNFLSNEFCHKKLTPFCPLVILATIIKNEDFSSFKFEFPVDSIKNFSNPNYSQFFKNAKINFNLSSFSYILDKDLKVGTDILFSIMNNDSLKETFLSQFSNTKNEDFFNVKINMLLHFPDYAPKSWITNMHSEKLNAFVTEIISQKKIFDKTLLFKLMSKDHLILALHNNYFSLKELSQFITDKKIHYHLLNHKLTPLNKSTKIKKI